MLSWNKTTGLLVYSYTLAVWKVNYKYNVALIHPTRMTYCWCKISNLCNRGCFCRVIWVIKLNLHGKKYMCTMPVTHCTWHIISTVPQSVLYQLYCPTMNHLKGTSWANLDLTVDTFVLNIWPNHNCFCSANYVNHNTAAIQWPGRQWPIVCVSIHPYVFSYLIKIFSPN